MSKRIDFTGQRFGKLRVLSYSHTNEQGHAIWKCQCDCGNEIYLASYVLRNGVKKSCGCWKEEKKGNLMYRSFRYRLYPNAEQKVIFAKTFGCVRFIYNKMLEDKIKYYEQNKKMLKINYSKYVAEFPWLNEADSQALGQAGRDLSEAYKNFFKHGKGYPKFKSKKNRKCYRTTNNATIRRSKTRIRVEGNSIILPKVGKVKMKKHRDIPDGYIIKSASITQEPSGKYFVSVKCEYESQVEQITPKTFIGLDFSMPKLYVDSNGNSAEYPKFYRQDQEKLAREQRKLDKMKYGSNNYEKQRIVVAKIHEKIANQRKDFLHKLSRQIANAYDCVCIENLNIKGMRISLRFSKAIDDIGWCYFTRFLSYKLDGQGKRLIKIDRFFPSTQVCSNCGFKNTETKSLNVREWTCPNCGEHHDRDINSAINIRNEGMRLLTA